MADLTYVLEPYDVCLVFHVDFYLGVSPNDIVKRKLVESVHSHIHRAWWVTNLEESAIHRVEDAKAKHSKIPFLLVPRFRNSWGEERERGVLWLKTPPGVLATGRPSTDKALLVDFNANYMVRDFGAASDLHSVSLGGVSQVAKSGCTWYEMWEKGGGQTREYLCYGVGFVDDWEKRKTYVDISQDMPTYGSEVKEAISSDNLYEVYTQCCILRGSLLERALIRGEPVEKD